MLTIPLPCVFGIVTQIEHHTASAEERRTGTTVADQHRGTGVPVPISGTNPVISNLDPALVALGINPSLSRPSILGSSESNIGGSSTINIQRDLTTDNLRVFNRDNGRETQTVHGDSEEDSVELITGGCFIL